MDRLSVEKIIELIKNEERFHAVSENYSFSLKIDEYVPFVCGAVHDGHQFREELWDNCLHSEYERWYEEDPETKNMVITQPILIAGRDSRFEYDLNRTPEEAVFETAWGKQLWKIPLSEEMKQKSLKKHSDFYKVVKALISKIEEKFKCCIVYDMHSYNWRRWDREVPTWNLGTSNINNDRFGKDVEKWQNILGSFKLPHNIKSDCLINNTFQGNGYFLKYITNNFTDTLVLATEIAKVYCHEYHQIIYPEVVASVEKQLREHLRSHAEDFYNRHSN